jgi:hypothetical protein
MISHRFAKHTLLIFGLLFAFGANAETTPPSQRDWIERWDIRYLLYIDASSSMISRASVAKDANAKRRKEGGSLYFVVDEMLNYERIGPSTSEGLATALLRFDEAGKVIKASPILNQFQGKRNVLDHIVLVTDPKGQETGYFLANWWQGVPGSTIFSPAVCDVIDRAFRYGAAWESGGFRGDVGCREWTAQLYDSDRPYIDVTTYATGGNFIGRLVGWSRFEDPPKPVIGQQGKTWLCLYECPAGEKPGVIKDIAAWTRKHGFPMPVRPKKQPEFPDADINWDD